MNELRGLEARLAKSGNTNKSSKETKSELTEINNQVNIMCLRVCVS